VLVQAGQPFEDSERASSGCWSVVGDTDNRVGALDNHLKLERLVGVPLCFVTQVAWQARHVRPDPVTANSPPFAIGTVA
jgi:hypothetical protein